MRLSQYDGPCPMLYLAVSQPNSARGRNLKMAATPFLETPKRGRWKNLMDDPDWNLPPECLLTCLALSYIGGGSLKNGPFASSQYELFLLDSQPFLTYKDWKNHSTIAAPETSLSYANSQYCSVLVLYTYRNLSLLLFSLVGLLHPCYLHQRR